MALRISFNCTPYWLLTQLANPSASSQDFKARLIFNFHRGSHIIFVYVLDLLTKNVHGEKQHKYDNKRMHRVRGSPSNLVLRHGWVTFGAEAGNNRQCSERVGRSLAAAAAENTCGCCWCCAVLNERFNHACATTAKKKLCTARASSYLWRNSGRKSLSKTKSRIELLLIKKSRSQSKIQGLRSKLSFFASQPNSITSFVDALISDMECTQGS